MGDYLCSRNNVELKPLAILATRIVTLQFESFVLTICTACKSIVGRLIETKRLPIPPSTPLFSMSQCIDTPVGKSNPYEVYS